MDPYASRLVGSDTEYSAAQGSSGFPNEHLSGMDTAILLLAPKQGTRSLERYIAEYLALANGSELPDCILIDFFCDGLNQPLKSKVIHKGPRLSPSHFLDYVLWTVGSAFTVGVAEERDTTLNSVIAAALEHTHKMAATTETVHKMAATKTPRHVIVASHESSWVTADVKEPSQATVDLRESSQTTVDRQSLQVSAHLPESLHVCADLPESLHICTDLPESLHICTDLPDSLHVSADLPESRHVSADLPESRHVSADLPEPHHVSTDLPEPLHIMSTTSEPRPVAVVVLQPSTVILRETVIKRQRLASSVEDPPLVSARTAGIPKPIHFSPPVPELIPLSVVLPTMGITLWCIWATYTTTETLETAAATAVSPEVAADAANS